MSVLEILETHLAPSNEGLVEAASIDGPHRGQVLDSYALDVSGAVVGRVEPPVAVKLTHGAEGLRGALVEGSSALLTGRRSREARFSAAVGVLGLPPVFDVTVHAMFRGNRVEPMATIRARHQPVQSEYEPHLQPLMVTSLARTGTTWLMKILGEHPAVAIHRRHPYEMVPGRYWMHTLKVLSEPANHLQSTPVSQFEGDRFRIGHNPFFYGPFLASLELRRWFERTHVERLAAFCQEMIDSYYRSVAAHQGQDEAGFFAEKHLPDHIQWMMWELYPSPREIFLLRDPRDMLASMVAFNEKRGYLEFGRENVASDEEWLLRLRRGVGRLVGAWRARSDRARVLRYEDLITDPVGALSPILDYLGPAAAPGSIEGLIARASANAPELAAHRTSKSAERSIGRWRQSLDRHWWPLVDEAFGDLLGELGYD